MSGDTLRVPIIRLGCTEVAANSFQRDTFNINLTSGSKAKTPENRYRRTPSLNSVLKEESAYDQRDCKPPSINRRTKRSAAKCENGSICFKQSLNVPLLV